MKKPLAAMVLSAAAVASLAVPAGASTRINTTWTHQTMPCAGGHHVATLTMKWRGGAVQKGWYDNPCGHQWLSIDWLFADSQSNGGTFVVPPHHKGQWNYAMQGTLVYPGS